MTDRNLLPTLAAPDDDPRLWLEEIEGERALAFVDAQTARTMERFGGPRWEADRDTLAALMNRKDRIPYITRRGAHVYNVWQDAENPRGLWRRTSLDAYRASGEVDWELVLDLDALARLDGEDWVWGGSLVLPGSHDRAMLRLSRGGSDAAVHREFDLVAKRFVEDGFTLPEAKGHVTWLDRDTLLLFSVYGDEEMATTSGYARTGRLWRRGSDAALAPVIFEVPKSSMMAYGGIDRTDGLNRIWFTERTDFFNGATWTGDRSGPVTRIDVPTDCDLELHGDWMLVKPRTPWTVGGTTHGPDRMLGTSLAAFLAGERRFEILFEPGERRVLGGVAWSGGHFVLSILDNLSPLFEVVTPGRGWARRGIDTLSRHGVVLIFPLDAESSETNGTMLVQQEDPVTPPQMSMLDVSVEPVPTPALLRTAPAAFDAAGLVVTRLEAVAADGERIPYQVVGPKALTGEAPIHLTGYGGFEVPLLPHYQGGIGKLWLERGGTSVVANIRGGGEFGVRWHEAGRLAGKKQSHDDFAAVAADLVARGFTRPGRVAAEGGSNGGLLIANMLTRHPGHFGALFCTIPLIDMRRYSKLLAGASWIAEYGDPDKPEDWAFLGELSAYHRVETGRKYPPILIATTRRDDRVHPGHARKMAAKLQDLGYEAHYYEPAAGGHGYGKDNAERAAFVALGYRFLAQAIGWEPHAV